MNNKPWITIMLTSKCNNYCSHCYINYDGDWDVSEVVECINDLKGTYNINLDGAEILTKPEYLSLFPLVDQHHLMTNGKAIYENPSLIDLLKQNGITDVSISYHYGIHDEVSSFRSSCVEQTIKLLLSSNFNVTVMTMLNKKNFLLIPDICDFFVSFGIKKVMFANYICQGKNKDRNSILDKNEVNCALNSIHSMRQKYESSDFYVSRTGAFGFDSMHGCNLCCDAGTEGFVILPNRKVCPCVFLCENNFFIGEYAKGCDFLSCSTFAHDFYSCFALENLNYCTDK